MGQCCCKHKFISSRDIDIASTSPPRNVVASTISPVQVGASSVIVETRLSPHEVDASSIHVAITSLPNEPGTSSTCKVPMSSSHESVAFTSRDVPASTSLQPDSQVLREATTDNAGKTNKLGGHTMISYNWTDAQEIAHKVSDELQKVDFPVWIDKEKMRGNMYERMAEAVTNADVILIFLSSNYEKSENCKREASMAGDLKKHIIPIHIQDGYTAGGWLHLLTAGKLYHDFRRGSFDENFKQLLKDIEGGHNPDITQQDKGENDKLRGERLYAKLKNALKPSAERSTKITGPIPGKQIRYVRLQITTNSERSRITDLEDTGHFNKREDFLDVFRLSQGNVELKDLFNIAEERGRTDKGKYCCDNDFCSNAIGIIGQAGIGKTTLCKHIINEYLQTSQSKFDTTFYILFRNIDYETKYENLIQFLMTSSSSEWDFCKEEDETILQLLRNDDKVLLILDGLDEAKFVKNRVPTILHLQSATSESYLKNILCGNILPKATKLVTSRPRQMFEMNYDCRPHFLVDILGLSSEAKEELCRQICGDNSDKVMKYLDEHPDISANCYVPVTCILVANAINMNLMGNDLEIDCNTITSIMLFTLKQLVRVPHHIRDISRRQKQQELGKLANLAMEAFLKGQVVFRERDFDEFEIDKEIIQAFLQTHTNSGVNMDILDGDKISCFSHLTWQEFFSAIYLILFMDIDSFSENQTMFGDSKYEVCVKFMMGLCNNKNIRCLESLFGYKAKDFNLKLEGLKLLILETMSHLFAFDDALSKTTFYQVCTWVYEAKLQELTNVAIDNLPSELTLGGKLLPSDVNGLHYVLRSCNKLCQLNVKYSGNDYVADSCFHFFKELATTLESPHISASRLYLYDDVDYTDEGMNYISSCLDHFEHLSLKENLYCVNNITSYQPEILGKGLAEMSTPLKSLQIGRNFLLSINGRLVQTCGDEELKPFAVCLNKVENLDMKGCRISCLAIPIITNALSKLSEPMKSLHLSRNQFGDDGAKELASCVNKVERLYISSCNISSSGITCLANSLKTRLEPMKSLDLSKNEFGDDGAKELASCLNKVDELNIEQCDLSSSGIKSLQDALSKMPKPKPEIRGLNSQNETYHSFPSVPPVQYKSTVQLTTYDPYLLEPICDIPPIDHDMKSEE